jgi:hypothetical protein
MTSMSYSLVNKSKSMTAENMGRGNAKFLANHLLNLEIIEVNLLGIRHIGLKGGYGCGYNILILDYGVILLSQEIFALSSNVYFLQA